MGRPRWRNVREWSEDLDQPLQASASMTAETPDRQDEGHRLDCLEGELRRLRLLCGFAVALLILVFLLAATGRKVPDEVRANRFVLLDDSGRVRAVLDVAPVFDIAGLRLLDNAGRTRASIAVAGDGSSGMNLYTHTQATSADLSADP